MEIPIVGEMLEFLLQKGMEISHAIVCLKNFNWKYLNIPSVFQTLDSFRIFQASFTYCGSMNEVNVTESPV